MPCDGPLLLPPPPNYARDNVLKHLGDGLWNKDLLAVDLHCKKPLFSNAVTHLYVHRLKVHTLLCYVGQVHGIKFSEGIWKQLAWKRTMRFVSGTNRGLDLLPYRTANPIQSVAQLAATHSTTAFVYFYNLTNR